MSLERQEIQWDLPQFDTAFDQNYTVLHEKALICPCVAANENNRPDPSHTACQGTGFQYLAGTDIQAIISGISNDNEWALSGIQILGMVTITTPAENRLGFRDRITLPYAKVSYAELVRDGSALQQLRYPIIDTEGVLSTAASYVKGTDFTIEAQKLRWLITPPSSYSIRYLTYPRWVVLNFPNAVRGTMAKAKRYLPEYVEMPIRALAKLEWRLVDGDF